MTDLAKPFVEELAKVLPPYDPATHRVVSQSSIGEDGSLIVNVSIEPIPIDQLNLLCDGC